jgi:hypothetical protein
MDKLSFPVNSRPVGAGGRGDVHVVPIADLREHVKTLACWCAPRLERVDRSTCYVVVHHALDGRELVEEHGIN